MLYRFCNWVVGGEKEYIVGWEVGDFMLLRGKIFGKLVVFDGLEGRLGI